MFQKSQVLGGNNLLRKIFIQLIVLAMFIAFIPLGILQVLLPKKIPKKYERK